MKQFKERKGKMNQKPVMRLEGLKYALAISLVLWWGIFYIVAKLLQ